MKSVPFSLSIQVCTQSKVEKSVQYLSVASVVYLLGGLFISSSLILYAISGSGRLCRHWIRVPHVALSRFTSRHFINRRWTLLWSWWCSETLLRASWTWDSWRPRHSPITASERCASLQLIKSKSTSSHFTSFRDSIPTACTGLLWFMGSIPSSGLDILF